MAFFFVVRVHCIFPVRFAALCSLSLLFASSSSSALFHTYELYVVIYCPVLIIPIRHVWLSCTVPFSSSVHHLPHHLHSANPLLSSDVVHQLLRLFMVFFLHLPLSVFLSSRIKFPLEDPGRVPTDGIIIISVIIAGFLLCDPEQGRGVLQQNQQLSDGTFLGRVSRPR